MPGFRLGIDGREFLEGQQTGIGRYIRNFLKYCPPLHPETTFFVYGNQHTSFDLAAANVRLRLEPERYTLYWDQRKLPAMLAEDEIDLFLSPYDKGPLNAPCPFVLTIHDLLFLILSEKSGLHRAVYDRLYKLTHRPMARKAARILTVSGFSRDEICRYYGIPASKVEIVPNAISDAFRTGLPQASGDDMKSRLRVKRPFLLGVSNYKPHKNVGALVEAYGRLPLRMRSDLDLILVGKEDRFRPGIADLISTRGLQDQIRFVDFVTDTDLALLYANAEAFVCPSKYEGFGLPPLEAMACGAPVVCSNATSLPEAAGGACLLVDPEPEALSAAILMLLDDDPLRESLREKGLKHVKRYHPKKIAQELYDRLLEVHRRHEG